MMDRLTPQLRSRLMSRVRRSGTAPELALRRALCAAGLRYRLKTKHPVPGSPDILFVGARLAVFVDGCFWHGCPEHGTQPKTRPDFWAQKIARNRARDTDVNARLHAAGWRVIRVWEHEVTSDPAAVVARVAALVIGNAL